MASIGVNFLPIGAKHLIRAALAEMEKGEEVLDLEVARERERVRRKIWLRDNKVPANGI
jgi:hypothetical protein